MAFIYDLVDTWNDGATTFNGIRLNVTDNASAAASNLIDLQVGGVSRFSVTKGAVSVIPNGGSISFSNTTNGTVGNNGLTFFYGTSVDSSALQVRRTGQTSNLYALTYSGIALGASALGFGSNAVWSNQDTILVRDAANTLAQRNGVNAQASRIYGTFTDASNHRRLALSMTTGGVAEIKPEGAGTGVSGNVLHISGLPTSNPGPGILWNNLGMVVVGT